VGHIVFKWVAKKTGIAPLELSVTNQAAMMMPSPNTTTVTAWLEVSAVKI
jgi:hypothetical protein